jgi:hypothetical protein
MNQQRAAKKDAAIFSTRSGLPAPIPSAFGRGIPKDRSLIEAPMA